MPYLLVFILLYFAWLVVVFGATFYGHNQSLRENPPEEPLFDSKMIPEWFDIGSIVQKPLLNGADFITDVLVIMQMNEKDGAESIFWLSTICFIFYLGSTATLTFLNSSKEQRVGSCILQFFNLRVLYETTYAVYLGRSTQQLEEIMVMSSLFEAFPQLFLQAYFSVWYFDEIPFITGLSVFFSIMTLARSVNHYEDIYGVVGRPRSYLDQTVTHVLLRLWRTTEIFLRIFLFIYVAFALDGRIIIFSYFVVSSIFTFMIVYYARDHDLFPQPRRLQSACLDILTLDIYFDTPSYIVNGMKFLENLGLFAILCFKHDWKEGDIMLFATTFWIWCMCTLALLPWMGRYQFSAVHFAREKNKEELKNGDFWDAYILLSQRNLINDVDVLHIGDMIEAEYSLMDFQRAKIHPLRLREAGYSMQDFQKAQFDVMDFILAGYTARQMYIAGFWSMKDLQQGGYSVEDYVKENFEPQEIREAGFTVSQMRPYFTVEKMLKAGIEAGDFLTAGYSVSELREAHVVAYVLNDYGVSAKELREGGYAAAELIGPRGAQLFGPKELKRAGYPTEEILAVGNSVSTLVNDDIDIHQEEIRLNHLVKNNVPLRTIVKVGFPISKIKEHFTLEQMMDAGISDPELKDGGVEIIDFLLQGRTIAQLLEAGFVLFDLRVHVPKMIARHPKRINLKDLFENGFFPDLQKANYKLNDFREGGISAASLRGAGYDLMALSNVGFSTRQLRRAGFPMSDFIEANFSTTELKKTGFQPEELGFVKGRRATVVDDPWEQLQQHYNDGTSASQCRDLGYSFADLHQVGYSGMQIFKAGYCLVEMQEDMDMMVAILAHAKDEGLKASDLHAEGLTNCSIFKQCGYPAEDMKAIGCDPVDLNSGGYSVEELLDAGFSKSELQDLKIHRKKNFENLKNRKFTVDEILDYGFSVDEMVNHLDQDDFLDPETISALRKHKVSAKRMEKRGSTLEILKKGGFKPKALKGTDFHPDDFRKHFTAADLRKAGFQSAFFKQEEGMNRQRSVSADRKAEIQLLELAWKERRDHCEIRGALRTDAWQQQMDLIDAKIQYLEEKTGLSPPPIPVDSLNAQSSEEEVDEILDDDDFEHQARLEGISPVTGSRFAPPMGVSPGSFPAPGVPSEGLKTDICSACGKDLTQDSKFCRHCGAPVTEKKRLASSPSGGGNIDDHFVAKRSPG